MPSLPAGVTDTRLKSLTLTFKKGAAHENEKHADDDRCGASGDALKPVSHTICSEGRSPNHALEKEVLYKLVADLLKAPRYILVGVSRDHART